MSLHKPGVSEQPEKFVVPHSLTRGGRGADSGVVPHHAV